MNQERHIIAIVGQKFVGKDTFADYILEHSEIFSKWEKKAFATSLKNVCKAAFHFSDFELSDPKEKEKKSAFWGYSPRELMQIIGTNLFREQFDQNIWIKNLEMDLQNTTNNVIVTDVRFENELVFLYDFCQNQKIKFTIVHILRPLEKNNSLHSSENHEWIQKYYQKWKIIPIENNGSILDFQKKIQLLFGFSGSRHEEVTKLFANTSRCSLL